MKKISLAALIFIILLSGCKYEVPVMENTQIPIDENILGLWQLVAEQGEDPDPAEKILVLKYSDSEYLIKYPADENAMYYRGYLIKLDGIRAVQLEVLGTESGPVDTKEKYVVEAYKVKGDILKTATINSDLIDTDITDSSELQAKILEHKHNKDLFIDPGTFKRINN